jgi:hypothetical protein
MPIATIAITGGVLAPDGTGVSGGKIEIYLMPPGGHADDGGTEQVIAPRKTVIIEDDGSVDFDLIGNDLITAPSGGATYYKAVYHVGDIQWTQYWDIDSTGGAIDIGEITILLVGADGLGQLWPLLTADLPATERNRGRPYRIKPSGSLPEESRVVMHNGIGLEVKTFYYG